MYKNKKTIDQQNMLYSSTVELYSRTNTVEPLKIVNIVEIYSPSLGHNMKKNSEAFLYRI